MHEQISRKSGFQQFFFYFCLESFTFSRYCFGSTVWHHCASAAWPAHNHTVRLRYSQMGHRWRAAVRWRRTLCAAHNVSAGYRAESHKMRVQVIIGPVRARHRKQIRFRTAAQLLQFCLHFISALFARCLCRGAFISWYLPQYALSTWQLIQWASAHSDSEQEFDKNEKCVHRDTSNSDSMHSNDDAPFRDASPQALAATSRIVRSTKEPTTNTFSNSTQMSCQQLGTNKGERKTKNERTLITSARPIIDERVAGNWKHAPNALAFSTTQRTHCSSADRSASITYFVARSWQAVPIHKYSVIELFSAFWYDVTKCRRICTNRTLHACDSRKGPHETGLFAIGPLTWHLRKEWWRDICVCVCVRFR